MSTHKKPTILIVEDEAELREILATTLEDSGFQILQAADGREGLATALEKHPDLILLDLLMPVMNGMEALRGIRQDAWGKKVPVMILTNLSADDETIIEEMVEQKPVCYIIKSTWEMQNIVAKIKEVLKID